MKKSTNWLYNSVSMIILVFSILAFYFFHFLEMPDGELAFGIRDWLHLIFTSWLGIVTVNTFRDKGTRDGLNSEAFKLANDLNAEINKRYTSDVDGMRAFIDRMNEHEKAITYENFFDKIRLERRLNYDVKLTADDLTKKELKRYYKLKPIYYSLEGFNLPIIHEVSHDKRVNYNVVYDVTKNKKRAMLTKALTGLLLGAVTVNVVWSGSDGLGALIKLAIVLCGLSITAFFNWVRPLHELSEVKPKQVLNKKAIQDSYYEYKTGKLVLKEINEEHELAEEKIEEPKEELKEAILIVWEYVKLRTLGCPFFYGTVRAFL